MSDASRENTYYVKATGSYGVAQTTPALKLFRKTSNNAKAAKTTNQSAELRADRQLVDFRHGTQSVTGDIGTELSFGSHDDLIEAALCGTWVAGAVPGTDPDVLKAGVVRRQFDIYRQFADQVNVDEPWHGFLAMEVNTMALKATAGGIITVQYSFIGRQAVLPAQTAPTGATFPAGTTTKVFDTFTGQLKEGGAVNAYVTELNLSLTNGLAPQYVLFSDLTDLPSIAKSMLTGSITARFKNSSLLKKFLAETESSLEVTFADPIGNTYVIVLPRIIYSDGGVELSGDGPLNVTLPFTALYDATANSQIVFKRLAAA